MQTAYVGSEQSETLCVRSPDGRWFAAQAGDRQAQEDGRAQGPGQGGGRAQVQEQVHN